MLVNHDKLSKLTKKEHIRGKNSSLKGTQWYGEKPRFVLVEMADRAGNGRTELQIKFESHGAEWSRPKWYGRNPHMFRSP